MKVLFTIYAVGWVYTYWHDSSILYNMGYSYVYSVLAGVVDGFIWPIRWGYDLIMHLKTKRKAK